MYSTSQLRADAKSFIPTPTSMSIVTKIDNVQQQQKQKQVKNHTDHSNHRRSKTSKTKSQQSTTNQNHRRKHHGRAKMLVRTNSTCEGNTPTNIDKCNNTNAQCMHKFDISPSPSLSTQKLSVNDVRSENPESQKFPTKNRQQHPVKNKTQQSQRRPRRFHHDKCPKNDRNPERIMCIGTATVTSNSDSNDSFLNGTTNDDITKEIPSNTSFPTLQLIEKNLPNLMDNGTTLSKLSVINNDCNNNVWSTNYNTNHLLQSIQQQQQQQEMEHIRVLENKKGIENDTVVQFVPLVSLRSKNKNHNNCNQPIHLINDKITNQELVPNIEKSNTTIDDCNNLSLAQIRSIYKTSSLSIDKLRDRWWNLLKVHEQQQKQQQQNHNREQSTEENKSIKTMKEVNDNSIQTIVTHQTSNMTPVNQQLLRTCTESKTNSDTSSNHTIPDTAIYRNLSEAIYHNDIDQLKALLRSNHECYDQNIMKLLHLAVILDRPNLVRILCTHLERYKQSVGCYTNRKKQTNHTKIDTISIPISIPLLIAVEHGYDECLNVLLLYFGITSLLTTKDMVGNTALHCCCICNNGTNHGIFPYLLDYIASSSGCTSSFLFKVLSCQNHQQQTPLHVAAKYGRADIVDIILNHRLTSNITLLTKLLSMQDIEGQTPLLAAVAAGSIDVVMSLQMWRGNNYTPKRMTSSATVPLQGFKNAKTNDTSSIIPCPCPLAWAVKFKNVDMVSLLLEFNNPLSESGYKLNDALCTAIDSESFDCGDGEITNIYDYNDNDTTGTTLEIIRVLVEAGANPCAIDEDETQSKSKQSKPQRNCAIILAAAQCKLACLEQLLDSYDQYLYQVRYRRRHDPKLQSQPESFFVGIESTENAERTTAVKEALLLSLSMIQFTSNSKLSQGHVKCSIMLYERGVQLGRTEIARLVDSFIHRSPITQLNNGNSLTIHTNTAYDASKRYLLYPNIQNRNDTNDSQSNQYWSRIMAKQSWFENVNVKKCAFLSSSLEGVADLSLHDEGLDQSDVVITCIDGQCLYAHRAVLAMSAKLDAAVRFATMSSNSTDDILQINVDLSYSTCLHLLIHMYHGSLLHLHDKLSIMNQYEFCMEILELMVLGDEYLCQSFIVECITRLLAPNNDYDRCYCSYCRGSITYEPKNINNNNDDGIGQSHLITADTVLDVLAITQQIRWNTDVTHENNEARCSKNESSFNNSLLNKLLEVALYVSICDFGTVIQSDAFIATQCSNDPDEDVGTGRHFDPNATKGMMLQMILNEIYTLKCN